MSILERARKIGGHTRARAILVGTIAVVLWSSLAPLTAMARGIPPLELLAATFGIGYLCGQIWLRMKCGRSSLRKPAYPYVFSCCATAALFGYHALYFLALSLAPPAQACLVAYLWPLLMVLLSSASSGGDKVRPAQLMGAVLGFAGTGLVVLSGDSDHIRHRHRAFGLLAALSCALIWSSYSVFNRRFREVPSEAMIDICGLVAVIGCGAHLLVDSHTVFPLGSQWLAIVALGAGPVGLSFLAWDYATKHGQVATLGTISYAAPVLSTLQLVMLGYTPASLDLLTASALVVAGAWIATALPRAGRPSVHPHGDESPFRQRLERKSDHPEPDADHR